MTDSHLQAEEIKEGQTGDQVMSVNGNRVVKTSMTLPQSSLETLRRLAEASGTSMAEVVRKAVAMEKFLYETTQAGGKILIKDKGSAQLRELIIR